MNVRNLNSILTSIFATLFVMAMVGCDAPVEQADSARLASDSSKQPVPGCDSNGAGISNNPHCTQPTPEDLDSWRSLPTLNGPGEIFDTTAVWTGKEMIVWGGRKGSGAPTNHGAKYNPSTNKWTQISITNAPAARSGHTAIWTGSEMIIWGGGDNYNVLGSGGKYNPSTDTWDSISMAAAPAARGGHRAVWTGTEMLVFGGGASSGAFNNGARYNPITNSWHSMTIAPVSTSDFTAVWSGEEMIITGGSTQVGYVNGSYSYSPSTDLWSILPSMNAPGVTVQLQAFFALGKMFLYAAPLYTGDLYLYSPTNKAWEIIQRGFSDQTGALQTAIWNGQEALFWGGGTSMGIYLNQGVRYNPGTNKWSKMSDIGAPSARRGHVGVWTGSEMLIWGGVFGTTALGTGGAYTPPKNKKVFQTIDSYAGLAPNFGGVARAITLNGDKTIYTAGVSVDATGGFHWLVRKSADLGASWSNVDSYQLIDGSPAVANAIAIDPSGTIYVGGYASDAPNGGHMFGILRKSSDQGHTWTTVDTFSDVPLRSGNTIGITTIIIDSIGKIFTAGSSNGWTVRKSSDGGLTWNTVDNFKLASGRAASATSMTQDKFGNIYVAGLAQNSAKVGFWYVRKSSNSGATWSTVDNYSFQNGDYAVPAAIAADSVGNVYVAGNQGQTNFAVGTGYWIVRKGTQAGTQWSTVDSTFQSPMQPNSNDVGIGGQGITVDPQGKVYVAKFRSID